MPLKSHDKLFLIYMVSDNVMIWVIVNEGQENIDGYFRVDSRCTYLELQMKLHSIGPSRTP